jgi:glutathione S-transferase
MSQPKPLILYNHPVSSYAQKIRIALREKSLPFTPTLPLALSTGGSDPTFQSANPRLEVPTLIDGDVQIFDSTIILEYIEDKWPTPPLLPPSREHAAARANARMIEDVCDTSYEAVNWGWGEVEWMGRAGGELKEKLRGEAERQTRELQGWLEGKLGGHEYFGGEFGFGWADVCVAPIVNRSDYFGWGPLEGSKLRDWLERVRARESVRSTFAEFAAAVGGMSAMAEKYRSGERKREYRDHRLEWMVKSGGIEIVRDGLAKGNIRFVWPEAKI